MSDIRNEQADRQRRAREAAQARLSEPLNPTIIPPEEADAFLEEYWKKQRAVRQKEARQQEEKGGEKAQRPQPMPGRGDFDAVLAFLPLFDEPGFEFARTGGCEQIGENTFSMPYVSLAERADAFVHALYDHNFIRPFDWLAWQDEAVRYFADPSALREADLETICKLLTTHVRKERFCEGHLLSMHRCGHLTALLRRLAEMRSLDGGES